MDAVGEHRDDVPQEPVAPRRFTSSLFVKVAAAEPEGWLRLDAIVREDVVGSARKAGIPAQDSEDLAQEVCGDIARQIADFRRERNGDALRAWVKTITRSKITDYLRVRRKRAEGEPVGGEQGELPQIADRQPEMTDFDPRTKEGRAYILDAALALVSAIVQPWRWKAFREIVLRGREVAEVATELGVTPHAVSDAACRVRGTVIQTATRLAEAADAPT